MEGTCRTTPTSMVSIVGVPQPNFAIGPKTCWSRVGGKTERRSLMMRWAFSTTFCGNRTEFSDPVRTALASGLRFIERWMPASPPMPLSVKPKPSWMGGSSAVMSNRNE